MLQWEGRGSSENTHQNLRFWQTRLPGWCCGCAHRNKAMPERVPAAVKLKKMAIWKKKSHPQKSSSSTKIQKTKNKKNGMPKFKEPPSFLSGPQLLLPMRPSNSAEASQLQHGAVHCQGRSVQFISNRPRDGYAGLTHVPRESKANQKNSNSFIKLRHIFVANWENTFKKI